MIIQEDDSSANYQIRRYEPGKIWINDQCYQNSVIIRAHQLLTPWSPRQLTDITTQHFEAIYANPPKILLLGTGSKLHIPPQSLLIPLMEKGIGVEFMDSLAACYTYTVLIGENRDVTACILID